MRSKEAVILMNFGPIVQSAIAGVKDFRPFGETFAECRPELDLWGQQRLNDDSYVIGDRKFPIADR
jgi:hypothetical protein